MVPIDAVPEPSDGLMPNGGDCPEAQAMRSDTQQALIEALATLAPEPRAVVVMILIEGMSYDDVAESLDMPLGTVRSKLHRARKQLQERLRVNLDQQPRAIVNSTRSSRVVSLF
jgi:RNA polymerase sigma-70 factor (ECF subfamily)